MSPGVAIKGDLCLIVVVLQSCKLRSYMKSAFHILYVDSWLLFLCETATCHANQTRNRAATQPPSGCERGNDAINERFE